VFSTSCGAGSTTELIAMVAERIMPAEIISRRLTLHASSSSSLWD